MIINDRGQRSVQEKKPSILANSFISSMHIVIVTRAQNTSLTKRCVVRCIYDSQIPILYGGKSIKNVKIGNMKK